MKTTLNWIFMVTAMSLAVVPFLKHQGVTFHDFMFWMGCAAGIVAIAATLAIWIFGALIKPSGYQNRYRR